MQCQDNEFALKWEKLRLEAVGGERIPPPSSLKLSGVGRNLAL